MNEPTFTDAMLDLRQAVAKQMGSHQAYVQVKVDALVAAHEREMLDVTMALREAVDCACSRCQTANNINCDFENTPYKACLPMKWRNLVNNCGYRSEVKRSNDEAIAAHNRVAEKCREVEE